MKVFLLISCYIFVFHASVLGQCATEIPKAHINNPPYFPSSGKSMILYNLDKTLSVNIYVIASGFETYDFGEADYQPLWDELNVVFEPINLSFQICQEILVPNYMYNILSNVPDPGVDYDEEDEMLAQYYEPNVINVYYVEEIINIPPAAGYAYFPGGPDVIVLTKGSEIGTLVHEMGHFFGLYHTFETQLGIEFVNGSNCETTGDLVCDTPADNDGDVVDCQYASYVSDVNGDPYIPVINNYMSYYPAECEGLFTAGQYNRMAWQYLTERNYLW